MRPNESFTAYLDRAFGVSGMAACLRKSRTERTSAKTDHAALSGWLAAVRIIADQVKVTKTRRPPAEELGRRVAKLSVERTTVAILPWLVPLLLALVVLTYVPSISLWLPRTMGM